MGKYMIIKIFNVFVLLKSYILNGTVRLISSDLTFKEGSPRIL